MTTTKIPTAAKAPSAKPQPRQETKIQEVHRGIALLPKNKPILVVIPYCSQGAQGREIEYAVAGWRKHFKENFLIVLAGEDHPVTKTGDDICCIESPRVPGKEGQYRQHLDYVSCFRKVRQAFPDQDGFIFVADDCYAVNDFDLADVQTLKISGESLLNFDLNSDNPWRRDVAKTRELLLREGYPTRNYTTHLPQWFEWRKLEELWRRYDMDNESYVFETLYYNIYCGDRKPFWKLNFATDHFKCVVNRSDIDTIAPGNNVTGLELLKRATEGWKLWIQNTVDGWSPLLDQFLAQYYGI